MATYFILSKLYAISFMCTLNTRKIIRGRGTDRAGGGTDGQGTAQVHGHTFNIVNHAAFSLNSHHYQGALAGWTGIWRRELAVGEAISLGRRVWRLGCTRRCRLFRTMMESSRCRGILIVKRAVRIRYGDFRTAAGAVLYAKPTAAMSSSLFRSSTPRLHPNLIT
ncbi:hypothetical protein AX16_001619 [Volvariella volvacea WC 439]|nr:hypothetical protein AX16_001619 [Volvariella volvacea WC 439]